MWTTISKEGVSDHLYPIDLINNALGATRVQHDKDWPSKRIIFHATWKNRNGWTPKLKKLLESESKVFVEFDADSHIGEGTIDWFLKIIDVPNVIWLRETPKFWNPFHKIDKIIDVGMFLTSRFPNSSWNKPNNLLVFIDSDSDTNNLSKNIESIKQLTGVTNRVKIITTSKNLPDLGIETLYNRKFSPEGIKLFDRLTRESKVLVDFSGRITAGRISYTAMSNGCLPTLPINYGISDEAPELLRLDGMFCKAAVTEMLNSYDSLYQELYTFLQINKNINITVRKILEEG